MTKSLLLSSTHRCGRQPYDGGSARFMTGTMDFL